MNFDKINNLQLNELAMKYGDTFYILDSELFVSNFDKMLNAFRNYYPNTNIAYSYKTNYLPLLCRLVEDNGGYAEIVSEMEWWLTPKIGIDSNRVYYNGPYKKANVIEQFLLEGGHLNIDAEYEAVLVTEIARRHKEKEFSVGLRSMVDIGQDESSRFGMDVFDLEKIYKMLSSEENIKVVGLHLHLPFRQLDTFKKRIEALRDILKLFKDTKFEYISLGGGYMGEIDSELAREFDFTPPTYDDYAKIVAGEFQMIFGSLDNKPMLIIEPGSALVANTMKLVTKVVGIKKSGNRNIATLTGSTYNMNPSVKSVRRSISISSDDIYSEDDFYESLDMAGYTCIEGDYLYRGFSGKLKKGDFVIFNNVGSYSIVMKPPFILPDVAVIDFSDEKVVVKKTQEISDIFNYI